LPINLAIKKIERNIVELNDMNNFQELVKKNRSYRRFWQEVAISKKKLEELVDCARLVASGRNIQPLKYYLSYTPEMNAKIFPHLKWAGHLKNWAGPEEGERPSAYIVVLLDRQIAENAYIDHGIAMQTLLLAAVESGLGGCMIASINKEKLRTLLAIEENRYDILAVVALGKPKEIVRLVDMQGDEYKYWRNEKDEHFVPKRLLKDIII